MSESAATMYREAVNEARSSLSVGHGVPSVREAPPPQYEDLRSPRPESLPPYETPPASPTTGHDEAANTAPATAEHAHGPTLKDTAHKTLLSRSWTRGSTMLQRVSPNRLVSHFMDGHKALPTLPALSKQQQREWAAFKQAMDGERDSWIKKATLPEPARASSTASSLGGVQLALDLAREVTSSVKRDIEDARIHVDKFLALSHRILPGESRKAAQDRRAGTPDEAEAMFQDRMVSIEANRQSSLISAICRGVAKEPACESALLALAQQWGLDEKRLRSKLRAQVQSAGTAAISDQPPASGLTA
jgi:hypothetical protein